MSIRTRLIAFLSSLCLCASVVPSSFASLDPETKTPYRLLVVLHFADHRLLTDVFRDRVERELRDGLQASFGDLVRVEVTREHPRLAEVVENGLKSLDGWKDRASLKTHFVFIDYSGVHYEIQARQYDGLIGQPGPVIRRDRTRDRDFVAKAAALMIEQDFGLLGAFDRWPARGDNNEDKPVTVQLKGAGLGVPLDRWIGKGDVFAVVQAPRGEAGPGKPVVGALLRVDAPPAAGDGARTCRVFRRYEPPRDADGDGYRCVKLGTVSAPLRLRLLQALPNGGSGPLKDSLTVQIRHNGFSGDDLNKIEKRTEAADDSVDTTGDKNGVFANAAFVSVYSVDEAPRARIPVPLLDDQPIALAVNVAADAGSLAPFRKADWERHVDEAWQEQNEWFRKINDLAAKPDQRAAAMQAIAEAIQSGREDSARLAKERDDLAKDGPVNLPGADERLKKVREGVAELQTFLDKLKKIDAEENDPQKQKLRALWEQGLRLEGDEEMDKAIALFEGMLKEPIADEALKDRVQAKLDDLRKRWDPKNPEHRAARAFIYNVWPTLDDAGLKEHLEDARGAYVACKAVGDMISLRKLLRATVAHAVRMKGELDQLKPDVNIDDEKPAKLIKELSESLGKLARDVKETLDAAGK